MALVFCSFPIFFPVFSTFDCDFDSRCKIGNDAVYIKVRYAVTISTFCKGHCCWPCFSFFTYPSSWWPLHILIHIRCDKIRTYRHCSAYQIGHRYIFLKRASQLQTMTTKTCSVRLFVKKQLRKAICTDNIGYTYISTGGMPLTIYV